MVHQLVDRRVDEAGELDLGDRPEALRGEPDRQPGDGVFGEWRIEHALRPKALQEAVGGAEHAALGSDIFAEDEDSAILRHGAGERQIDGLDEVDLGHRRITPARWRAPLGAARRDPWAVSGR